MLYAPEEFAATVRRYKTRRYRVVVEPSGRKRRMVQRVPSKCDRPERHWLKVVRFELEIVADACFHGEVASNRVRDDCFQRQAIGGSVRHRNAAWRIAKHLDRPELLTDHHAKADLKAEMAE